MNNQSKQIIPDTDAVICLLDETITERLNYHDTYKSESLLDQLWESEFIVNDMFELLEEVLEKVYHNESNINNSTLARKIRAFIEENREANSDNINQSAMIKSFSEGVSCNLLQPNGRGWQKGQLKICFEFIAEDDKDLVITKESLAKTSESPLDEIRQLTSSLPVDQN